MLCSDWSSRRPSTFPWKIWAGAVILLLKFSCCQTERTSWRLASNTNVSTLSGMNRSHLKVSRKLFSATELSTSKSSITINSQGTIRSGKQNCIWLKLTSSRNRFRLLRNCVLAKELWRTWAAFWFRCRTIPVRTSIVARTHSATTSRSPSWSVQTSMWRNAAMLTSRYTSFLKHFPRFKYSSYISIILSIILFGLLRHECCF